MPFDPEFALKSMLPLAEAAYDLKKLPADWKLISTIEPDRFGLVAEDGWVVAVAFRGTQSDLDWVRDFDAIPVPAKFGLGLVHRGFQESYLAVRESVRRAVASANTKNLWITGHSLGAAMGTLCTADFASLDPLLYTFEGPRVGVVQWADWFNKSFHDAYRVVNEWDAVPHLPPFLNGYKHAGIPAYIDSGFTDDPHVAHSLASVEIGLQKLLKG